MSHTTPLYVLDAFTDVPFRGNPAGVCLLQGSAWPDAAWLQNVAAEVNHAETAFLLGPTGKDDGDDAWRIRYFAPQVEVELCGHATLATAALLHHRGDWRGEAPLHFHTHVKEKLICTLQATAGSADAPPMIAMRFPRHEAVEMPPPPGLLDALGLQAAQVKHCARGPYDWIVEVADVATVEALQPNFAALRPLAERGAAVTTRGQGQVDCVSRFFAPAVGIDEDQVTGSLHCVLGPYWADRLGRTELVAYQASARGGTLHLRIASDHVQIAGQAVLTFAGELRVTPH